MRRNIYVLLGMACLAGPGWAQSPPQDGGGASPGIEGQLNIWEKRLVQEGLITLGLYNGYADGNFGKGTHDAIATLQSKSDRPATGQLSADDALGLANIAINLRKKIGWDTLDTVSGAQMAYPAAILVDKQTNKIGGEDIDSKDHLISLETFHFTGQDDEVVEAQYQHELNNPKERVTYKLRSPHGFILSGDRDGTKFYTRYEQQSGDVRGFDLTWDAGDDTLMQRVSVLISSAFHPFGDDQAQGGPSYPTLERLIDKAQGTPQTGGQDQQKPAPQDQQKQTSQAQQSDEDQGKGVTEYKEGSEPWPTDGSLVTPGGRGLRFTYQYLPPKNPDLGYAYQWATDTHLFRSIPEIDGLDGLMVLPHPLRYVTAQCGQVNAFYAKDISSVVLCYEMIDSLLHMGQALSKGAADPKALTIEFVTDNIRFILLHESGHAMIDMLDLPAVGREEDSVDQLAAVMLLLHVNHDEAQDSLARVLQLAATWFKVNAQGGGNADMAAYADEHSLDAQRYFNLLCIVYGSDTNRFAGIVKGGMLPEERAARCPEESAKITRSWARLLLPHFAPHYRPHDDASSTDSGGGGAPTPPAAAQGGNPLEWDGKSNPFNK